VKYVKEKFGKNIFFFIEAAQIPIHQFKDL
jgi:hypothetical protein